MAKEGRKEGRKDKSVSLSSSTAFPCQHFELTTLAEEEELSGAVAFFTFSRFSWLRLIVSSSLGKPIGVESKRAEKEAALSSLVILG